MATVADVTARLCTFPGMSALYDANVELFDTLAGDALNDLDEATWGDKRTVAAAYLTCHRFTLLARQSGAGGEITSERLGDYSVTFAQAAGGDLSQTVYGRLFDQLQKILLLTPLTV